MSSVADILRHVHAGVSMELAVGLLHLSDRAVNSTASSRSAYRDHALRDILLYSSVQLGVCVLISEEVDHSALDIQAGDLGSMLTGTLSSGWTGFTGLIAAHPIGLGVAAVSAAVALSRDGLDVPFFFNRKEAKDHGEGGMFVGKTLEDGEKVVIIEDVMTSGKALREVLPKLQSAAKIDIEGMIITVDRMEKGLTSDKSAVQEVYDEFGVKVYSIVTINDIIDALENDVIPGKEYVEKMKEYRKVYGVG